MEYRRLGDAGVRLSEIGLGGWLTFGNALDLESARAVMNRAFEVGINFFDTADVYGVGRCEEAWGQVLKKRRRPEYVLASKCFFPMGTGPNDRGLSRKHVLESCHASLKRLQTDYLDLYQCHRFDAETPLEETVRAMDDLIRQGKVLYWGFSEWPVERVEECLRVCGDRYYRPKGSQPCYNALERRVEAEVMPICYKAGIGQVVFSPLAQGILSGKYRPDEAAPADSRARDERQNLFIRAQVEDRELLRRVQRLVPLATEAGCTVAQLALAWILRRKEVTSCIIGATKVRQVEENAEASGMRLDDEVVRRVEEVLQ